jgi:hypothetical protein
MSQFRVGIVKLGRDPHAACFMDFAKALVWALRALGHEAAYASESEHGRLIMLGANNMHDVAALLPSDAIVFNSEQVALLNDPRYFMSALDSNRDRVVWDYSEANAAALRMAGMTRVVLCPLGYVPQMETIPHGVAQDIDVLFAGAISPRRRVILDALDKTDLKVARLFNCYGSERDSFIARSKIVLNLHYYPGAVYEIFRVSHLLANRKCVVSEDGRRDATLEAFAARATHYVPYGRIVEACRELAADHNARREQEQRGYEEFRRLDFVQNVQRALEAS